MKENQLKILILVAEHQSVSRVAEKLGISPTQISRELRLIESEWKCHLFVRNGRGLVLTEAGESILYKVRKIVSLYEQIRNPERQSKSREKIVVRLGLTPTLVRLMASRLYAASLNPAFCFDLKLVEGLSVKLEEQLIDGSLDFAFVYGPLAPGVQRLGCVIQESLVLVSRADDNRLHSNISLDQIPLVLPSMPNKVRLIAEKAVKETCQQINIIAEVDSVNCMLHLVQNNDVYTLLPETTLLGHPGQANFSVLKKFTPDINLSISLVIKRERELSNDVMRVASLLQENILLCLNTLAIEHPEYKPVYL